MYMCVCIYMCVCVCVYTYVYILIQVEKFAALVVPIRCADSAWCNHVFLGMAEARGIALRPFSTRNFFTFIPCGTVN